MFYRFITRFTNEPRENIIKPRQQCISVAGFDYSWIRIMNSSPWHFHQKACTATSCENTKCHAAVSLTNIAQDWRPSSAVARLVLWSKNAFHSGKVSVLSRQFEGHLLVLLISSLWPSMRIYYFQPPFGFVLLMMASFCVSPLLRGHSHMTSAKCWAFWSPHRFSISPIIYLSTFEIVTKTCYCWCNNIYYFW